LSCILYLDDEEALVFLVTRMLEFLGYKASGYTSATDALEAFASAPESFDLIITDLSMPRMSGLDFARQIVAIRADAPVAIATGYVEPSDQEAARQIGVLAVVTKPNTIEEMGRTVSELLEKARAATPADR
jgi:CheY-like chemotaxis protein